MVSTEQYSQALSHTDSTKHTALFKGNVRKRVQNICEMLRSQGVHSSLVMATAGFKYIGESDTVRCDTCQLEVSGWTKTMIPFSIHSERSPECELIRSRLPNISSKLVNQENCPKRQKTELNSYPFTHTCRLIELETLKQIRRRTFSHWSHQTKPSVEQMIAAGFVSCDVGDRVICLYCNLICQQWSADTDDPTEVHTILSPQCPYVLSMLVHSEPSSASILNELSPNNMNNTTPSRFDQLVQTTAFHPTYTTITKRLESFETTWSHESSPSVEELARSGFFYTGENTVVTCFYCNGSLKNWTANDSPMIEHARWFAHCDFAKQLCGEELYEKIQASKRARQEPNQVTQFNETNQRQLQINDSTVLARLVAARLDLSMSQKLLDQKFQRSVIKRCWENQFQLKKNDFFSESDLLVACTVLQKQIDHIKGNKDNIIIPSIKMELIRAGSSSLSQLSNSDNTETMQTQSIPPTLTSSTTQLEKTVIEEEKSEVLETVSTKKVSLSNPCVICYQDEKRLACIPCGHFTTCVSCSQTLRTCPTCRREIEAFVRIFM